MKIKVRTFLDGSRNGFGHDDGANVRIFHWNFNFDSFSKRMMAGLPPLIANVRGETR